MCIHSMIRYILPACVGNETAASGATHWAKEAREELLGETMYLVHM